MTKRYSYCEEIFSLQCSDLDKSLAINYKMKDVSGMKILITVISQITQMVQIAMQIMSAIGNVANGVHGIHGYLWVLNLDGGVLLDNFMPRD